MKKYIIAVLILFIPCVTYALTMCARDNSLVVALNSGIAGDSTAADVNDWTWRTDFSYGALVGEATCLNPTNGHPQNDTITGLTVRNDGTNVPNDFPKGMQGTQNFFCWCRITHPINTIWVYSNRFANGAACTNDCTTYCANTVQGNLSMRKAMFNSIGR